MWKLGLRPGISFLEIFVSNFSVLCLCIAVLVCVLLVQIKRTIASLAKYSNQEGMASMYVFLYCRSDTEFEPGCFKMLVLALLI